MPQRLLSALKSVPNVDTLVRLVGGEGLPIMVCQDEQFDDTVVDFSEGETVTLTQEDEHGVTHTVILSAKVISQISPFMLLWKSRYIPNFEAPQLKVS